jgi:hypothetical protein
MLINPKLPKHFFDCDNSLRSPSELKKFWQVPIILTEEYLEDDTWADYQERTAGNTADDVAKTEADFNKWIQEKKESWFKHFPTGTAYRVYCLDGGAWDRPTEWGTFSSLEEAKECCLTGPSW